MPNSLTDQELKTQFQNLSRGQLENYLLQVVRQLKEYQAKELNEEEKHILENLQDEKAILKKRLNEERRIVKRDFNDLNKKYNKLEQEQAALLEENQTLKTDQKAAIKVFKKSKDQKEAAEKESDKFQENLIAANKKASDLEKKLNFEKVTKKEITNLESQLENLINQNLDLQKKHEQERKKYEKEQAKATMNTTRKIVRYHPVIPFKNPRRTAEQIAWAVDTRFREDQYNLRNRNCEHFANMCIYGINYSRQIYYNKEQFEVAVGAGAVVSTTAFTAGGLFNVIGSIALAPATAVACEEYSELNNGKGSTIKLTNEMSESNGKLGEKDN